MLLVSPARCLEKAFRQKACNCEKLQGHYKDASHMQNDLPFLHPSPTFLYPSLVVGMEGTVWRQGRERFGDGANGSGAGQGKVWGWWERFEGRRGNGLRGRGGNGLRDGGWVWEMQGSGRQMGMWDGGNGLG